jgi:PQQ-dependent dehydrogenase (methanol/ethanol family)
MHLPWQCWVGALIVSAALMGCGRGSDSAPPVQEPARAATPTSVTATTASTDDGQWLMASKDYANTRFSDLRDITTSNVSSLKLAWTFTTGVLRGHEGAPLVVGDTMYFVTPFPNILYALDLANHGAKKWEYKPKPALAAQGVACCDVVNRGAAYAAGRVFFNTLDGYTVAVNATDGREVWKTKVGDINVGETITMAPIVVKGKVLVGNSGGEFGVRGWLTALNAADGTLAWRAFSTGPDADILIGDRFRPFYEAYRVKNLGVSTWPSDHWKIGGGSVWGWLSYDPELDLVYHGTGNPGPWNPDVRPGDNKWSTAVFARDPDDGQAVWAYQWSPHDLYDYDGINENVLLDLEVGGRTRKVLVRPERNGYLYVLDRQTGEVLSADPYVHVTTSKGVDLRTGRLIEEPSKATGLGFVATGLCPAAPGGKDWQPSAWSPRTRLLYIPHNNLCMDMEGVEANYIAGTPYVGASVKMYPGPGGHRGEFSAWDPVQRRKVWSIKESFPAWSGALATGGDVVFYGTMDRWFKALDARSGRLLWQFRTGSGIIGQPISFRGPDGKQYIAIVDGVGGWAGAIVAGGLDPRDETSALGFVGATKDLPAYTSKGGTIYVFALP